MLPLPQCPLPWQSVLPKARAGQRGARAAGRASRAIGNGGRASGLRKLSSRRRPVREIGPLRHTPLTNRVARRRIRTQLSTRMPAARARRRYPHGVGAPAPPFPPAAGSRSPATTAAACGYQRRRVPPLARSCPTHPACRCRRVPQPPARGPARATDSARLSPPLPPIGHCRVEQTARCRARCSCKVAALFRRRACCRPDCPAAATTRAALPAEPTPPP